VATVLSFATKIALWHKITLNRQSL